MLVMMAEGGEGRHATNINFLLEEFGIAVNSGEWVYGVKKKTLDDHKLSSSSSSSSFSSSSSSSITFVSPFSSPSSAPDSVVRTTYYKYFHPKEALITNGFLNRYHTDVAS